jgi:hypothetical protein
VFIRFTALCNSSTVSSSPTDVVVSVSVPRRPRVVDVVLVVRSRLLEPPFPCERMSVRPSSVATRRQTAVATRETTEDNFYKSVPRDARGGRASRVGVCGLSTKIQERVTTRRERRRSAHAGRRKRTATRRRVVVEEEEEEDAGKKV